MKDLVLSLIVAACFAYVAMEVAKLTGYLPGEPNVIGVAIATITGIALTTSLKKS